MGRGLLVIAGLLVSVGLVAAAAPYGWERAGFGPALFYFPTEERYVLEGTLQGAATDVERGEGFDLLIHLSGIVVRTLPDGPDQVERGELQAEVQVLDPRGKTLHSAFSTLLSYRGERVGGLLHGTDGWRFSLGNGAHEDPDLQLDAAGDVTGLQVEDGSSARLLAGYGALTAEPGGARRSTTFELDLAGEATLERI